MFEYFLVGRLNANEADLLLPENNSIWSHIIPNVPKLTIFLKGKRIDEIL